MAQSREKLLFNDYLFDKPNNKLNRLRVKLKLTLIDGKRVFNLDVSGTRPRAHLQLEFTQQDLCFVRLEEFQDHQEQERLCWPCFGHNYYTNPVYTRLLLLLYSVPENGEMAKCIKLPLLQPGNIHSATGLHRLQKCIYDYIVRADELKHWPVVVLQCAEIPRGERVLLGLTKYALLVVRGHLILQYHPFYASDIEMKTIPHEGAVEIVVQDKAWKENVGQMNFTLSRKYVFRTAHWSAVEEAFKNLLRKSQLTPQGPSDHFVVQHSEFDEIGVSNAASSISGNASIMIVPHVHVFENNNTSSSSSNGNIFQPQSIFTENGPPTAHFFPQHYSTNGSIPNQITITLESTPEEPEFVRRGTTQALIHERRPVSDEVANGRNRQVVRAVPVPNQLLFDPSGLHADNRDLLKGESDPGRGLQYLHAPTVPQSPSCGGIDNSAFIEDFECTEPKFAEGEEVFLPPPTPCSAFSLPHAEFSSAHPLPSRCHGKSQRDDSMSSKYPSGRRVLRSSSLMGLTDESVHLCRHSYVNMVQELSSKGSVHDDSVYFRFYYNIGFTKSVVARMSKKLKRRDRLSREMPQFDQSKLESHERWYDRDFKIREQDPKFCKLTKSVRSKSFTHRSQSRTEPVVGGSCPTPKSREVSRSSFIDDTPAEDSSITAVKFMAKTKTGFNKETVAVTHDSITAAKTHAHVSITTPKSITDDSITATKSVADVSMTYPASLTGASITAMKSVADDSITFTKSVADDSITFTKSVADYSITATKYVADDSITATKSVVDDSVTATKSVTNDFSSIKNPIGMNIPPDNMSSQMSSVNINLNSVSLKVYAESTKAPVEENEDDPYWAKSQLCISVQRILQEDPKETTLRDELLDKFDLSASQLSQVEVLLSLVPAESNWRTLADYIGLSASEVAIVEHFCYTYRVLAAKVILCHWMMNEPLQSNFDNLANFLKECDRLDVLGVLRRVNVNIEADVIESTYL